MDVLPEDVDNEKGNGSRTEIEDEKTGDKWDTKDKRADTQTTFYESDIDNLNVSAARKRRLKRILKRQEGENHGEATTGQTTRRERKQQNREEDRRRDIEIFASQLSLTGHQKRRTTHLVLDVLDVNSYGNYAAEEVILGVITYVCMEDMGADGTHVDDRDTFHELVDQVGTTMERVKGARQLTRDRLND
jgi:hypothetical protein